ncbi:MAG TPA: ABC transporter ATP-binding protein [Bacillota bacterium]|nr:ABC transporter ATP-binding protein [Bacillota bacterium]
MFKIDFNHVSFDYEEKNTFSKAIRDVDFSVKEGEFVSVIGPSGCGKSTLLSLAVGLNFPSQGSVLLNGENIAGTSSDRGVVFQHYSLFPWMTAKRNVTFGIRQVRKELNHRTIEKIADEYLDLVGLNDFKNKYPRQLSGGMQQRVAIARAFAMNPNILLMDEPFGAVDAKTRILLQEVLLNLWEKGERKKTVLFVTHDIDEAIYLSDKIIVMSAGPGTVKKEVNIPFARPRNRNYLVKTDEYLELRNDLLNLFYFYDELLQKIGGDEVAI